MNDFDPNNYIHVNCDINQSRSFWFKNINNILSSYKPPLNKRPFSLGPPILHHGSMPNSA